MTELDFSHKISPNRACSRHACRYQCEGNARNRPLRACPTPAPSFKPSHGAPDNDAPRRISADWLDEPRDGERADSSIVRFFDESPPKFDRRFLRLSIN
jgi:uncharacterized protein (TIGR02996 family)